MRSGRSAKLDRAAFERAVVGSSLIVSGERELAALAFEDGHRRLRRLALQGNSNGELRRQLNGQKRGSGRAAQRRVDEALEDTFPASDIPLHVGAGTKVEKLARQG